MIHYDDWSGFAETSDYAREKERRAEGNKGKYCMGEISLKISFIHCLRKKKEWKRKAISAPNDASVAFLPIGCGIYLNSRSGVCILTSCSEPDSIVYVWLWHLLLPSDSSCRNECQQCQRGGSLFNLVASAVAVKSCNINAHVCVLAFMSRTLIAHPKRSRSDSSLIHFLKWHRDILFAAARKGRWEFRWVRVGLTLVTDGVREEVDGEFRQRSAGVVTRKTPKGLFSMLNFRGCYFSCAALRSEADFRAIRVTNSLATRVSSPQLG